MKSHSFEQLIVWQKAHSYVLAIYKITKQYPKEELFCLVNQMRRAAASITANIAEGYAKISSKDKLRFYNIHLIHLYGGVMYSLLAFGIPS